MRGAIKADRQGVAIGISVTPGNEGQSFERICPGAGITECRRRRVSLCSTHFAELHVLDVISRERLSYGQASWERERKSEYGKRLEQRADRPEEHRLGSRRRDEAFAECFSLCGHPRTPGGTDCELMSPSLAELSRPDMIGLLANDPTSPKRSRLAQWRCGATKARCRADAPDSDQTR